MIKAQNPFAPFWFVPPGQDDTPEEQRTAFRIRGLTGIEMAYIAPEMRLDESGRRVVAISGRGSELLLEYGVLDWKNLADAEGHAVKFSRQRFAMIPYATIATLTTAVLAASAPDEEQEKNSVSQSK